MAFNKIKQNAPNYVNLTQNRIRKITSYPFRSETSDSHLQLCIAGLCPFSPRLSCLGPQPNVTFVNFYLRAIARHTLWISVNQKAGTQSCGPVMDTQTVTGDLLQISSKYSVDTTWNVADYAGNITARAGTPCFEPENMSRTWTIDHWKLTRVIMLTVATRTKMDTAKTFQVNPTVCQEVTSPFLNVKILYFHMPHQTSQCHCGPLIMRYLSKVWVMSCLISYTLGATAKLLRIGYLSRLNTSQW